MSTAKRRRNNKRKKKDDENKTPKTNYDLLIRKNLSAFELSFGKSLSFTHF